MNEAKAVNSHLKRSYMPQEIKRLEKGPLRYRLSTSPKVPKSKTMSSEETRKMVVVITRFS